MEQLYLLPAVNNLSRRFLMKNFLIRICHSLKSKCYRGEFSFLINFQWNLGRFPRQRSLTVCLSLFLAALLAGTFGPQAYSPLGFGADKVLKAGKERPSSFCLLGSFSSPDIQDARLTGCPRAEASCHEKSQHFWLLSRF